MVASFIFSPAVSNRWQSLLQTCTLFCSSPSLPTPIHLSDSNSSHLPSRGSNIEIKSKHTTGWIALLEVVRIVRKVETKFKHKAKLRKIDCTSDDEADKQITLIPRLLLHLWLGWVKGSTEDLEARDQVQTGARGHKARTVGPQADQETKN